MDIKILYDPGRKRVLTGITQHACMVKGNFDKYVRAIYFSEANAVYFRFWAPDGVYELTSWGDKKARLVCERALAEFKARELVPANVRPLYWETGHGVSELDIKY